MSKTHPVKEPKPKQPGDEDPPKGCQPQDCCGDPGAHKK